MQSGCTNQHTHDNITEPLNVSLAYFFFAPFHQTQGKFGRLPLCRCMTAFFSLRSRRACRCVYLICMRHSLGLKFHHTVVKLEAVKCRVCAERCLSLALNAFLWQLGGGRGRLFACEVCIKAIFKTRGL